MAEIDPFERSLAGAFLRLADDVPGTVDAAAVAHRVALEHPRRGARMLSWGGVAIPRVAWVLLAAGRLLVALVGGALLVGSQLQRRLPAVVPPAATCPPGSTPDEPGPVDQARPVGLSDLAFDRRAGRLVALVGAETWTFDVCTNTWTQMHPNRVPASSEWLQLVYDVDSDVTIGFASDGTRMWAYDLAADTWTQKRVARPTRTSSHTTRSPAVSSPGDDDATALWEYDVETDTWTPIRLAYGPDGMGPSPTTPPSTGWSCTLREPGRRRGSSTSAPAPGRRQRRQPPDWSRAGRRARHRLRRVGRTDAGHGQRRNGRLRRDRGPLGVRGRTRRLVPGATTVYDPVNGRLVGFGFRGDVVAFDLVTREWTVLLEASPAEPAP